MTNRREQLLLEKLRECEAKFTSLVETLPQLVWSSSAEGHCDFLSPQWEDYTGVPNRELLGTGWVNQLHPDDRGPTTEKWAAATATGSAYDTEFRLRGSDGSYRWFKASALPQFSDQGEIAKWFGCNTDIQDLRESQDELQSLNADLRGRVASSKRDLKHANEGFETLARQLQEAQRVARLGSWELDHVTGEVTWSQALYAIFGLDPEVGPPPSLEQQQSHFVEQSWSTLNKALERTLQTGEGYSLQLQLIDSDGDLRWILAQGEVKRDAQGEAVGLRGTAQEITELKRVQEQLERSSERQRLATGAAGLGIWDYDVAGDILVWDDLLHQIYGTDPETFGGKFEDWRACVHPDDLDAVETLFRVSLAGGTQFHTTFRARPTGGPTRYISGTAVVHFDDQGCAVRAIGVNWDVTAKIQAELQLQSQKVDLEKSNRDLEQFAYVASHDLQEPLRAVAGCAQILQRSYQGELDSRADELIQHIVEGANRMQTLILDLLAYSTVGKGSVTKTVDSRVVLEEALLLLQASIEDTHAKVTFGSLPTVTAEPIQLRQLFQNLIGNAIKYRGEKPARVEVSARDLGPEWEFAVADSGMGIDPKYFERIFLLFQRLHSRTEYPGTGIGLALCQRIVTNHGGRIWLESSFGHGSTFFFTLPKPKSGNHFEI